MKTTIEKIPEYMLPFFINGDFDGYSDSEIASAQNWQKVTAIKEVIPPTDEEYRPFFSQYPAFGLPCEVVECECVIEW